MLLAIIDLELGLNDLMSSGAHINSVIALILKKFK
jgi:hypothetical protein